MIAMPIVNVDRTAEDGAPPAIKSAMSPAIPIAELTRFLPKVAAVDRIAVAVPIAASVCVNSKAVVRLAVPTATAASVPNIPLTKVDTPTAVAAIVRR